MKISIKERQQYMKNIECLLFCKRKRKQEILLDFSNDIDEHLKLHPDASLEEITLAMGTPEEIADNFLCNESAAKIKRKLSLSRSMLLFFIILEIITTLFLSIIVIELNEAENSYTEVTLTQIEKNENDEQTETIIESYIGEH